MNYCIRLTKLGELIEHSETHDTMDLPTLDETDIFPQVASPVPTLDEMDISHR